MDGRNAECRSRGAARWAGGAQGVRREVARSASWVDNARRCLWAGVVLLGACGCVEKQDLASGEFDRHWNVTDVEALRRAASQPATAPAQDQRFPRRWVIRRGEDTAARQDLKAVVERLRLGEAEVAELSLSAAEAGKLVAVLEETLTTLKRLTWMVDRADDVGRPEWARLLAEVLVHVETVLRMAAGQDGTEDVVTLASAQVLKALGAWLRPGEDGLLAELSAGEVLRMREALTTVVVRAGFGVAGRETPRGLATETAEVLRSASQPKQAEARLGAMLGERLAAAPSSLAAGETRKAVRRVLSVAPRALQVVQSFLVQWKKIDVLEIDIREDVRVVTLAVRPGRQVRMEGLVSALPALALRGRTKIVILDDQINPAGETVISFQSEGGGGVYMLFDSIEHALARLAVPLENGRIREVRAFRDSSAEGPRMLNVKLLMESEASGGDRRRMIVVQDTETTRLVRTAFAVRTLSEGGRTAVSYLLPQRRYSYEHIKQPKVE